MKKLLAMVLALVMTLSLAVSANAAFKDDKSISDDYAESVAVLNGMGVFKGYEDGSFKPEGNITRAEVATIIYRIYTADVAKNDKSGLYATYNKFSDMAGAGWAQGYIGYCANASLVKGYPDGTFKPSGKVTGYEVLAMILRAVGYDKNNEFSGADWALHVAQTAQQLGVLDNVAKTTDLNAPASRELVAELLFQGIQKAQVTYTPAFGYVTDKVISTKTNSLGEKNFKLASAAASDKWGRPATKWTYTTGDKATTFVEKPDLTYTKAVAECDVAHDAGLKADTAYTLIVNGQTASTKYTVNLTDTKTKMGAQGRLFEVYDDTIVMIDTFLAKVTYVADITYDAQGHVKTPATITLEVYDGTNGTGAQKAATYTPLTLKDYDDNYGYAKDEYVLVNAYTDKATNSATVSGKVLNTADQYAEIVSKATSVDGAQSVIYWNAQQHNVEGTVYDDAAKFYLDQAAQKDAKYTWYFDSYNNLIGAVEIAAATSYGVINSIWWAGNAADGSGVAKANVTYMDGTTALVDLSKMTYFDELALGTTVDPKVKTGTVTHSTGINDKVMKAVGDYFYVDSYINTNAVADASTHNGILNGHLFQFTTKSNGTLDAVEVATGTAAKLYNLADVAVSKNTQVYNAGSNTLVVNSNTVFLVRSGAGTTPNPYTFKSITGFTNIDNYAKGEVDYVDLNGDKVADYVYVIAPTTTSKVTSLFYFDGQQGTYTLADGTWVVKGYVDGVAGEVKFANFDALQNTLKISGQTGYPVNNTLYVVTLEDGVVKSGHIVTDGEQLKGYANYPLSSAYNTYSDITINIVEGAAGTVEKNYSDRDTFADSLYHDYSANKYYSVVTDLTKVVGTMGNPADQHYYFVSIQNNGQLNALALQAYAYDKVKSGVDVPNAATVIGVALNANKTATVSLNDKNDAKKGDVYSVTLEQLRDNGYVAVGTFSGTVGNDGAISVTIDLNGVIGAGTYKVTAGSYTSIMSFAN